MKKSYLAIIFSFVMSMALHAQIEVPQNQQAVIVKIAADWCPPCGGWGWSFFDDIYADNSQDAILLSVHHSGGLSNSVAQSLTQNYQVFGQPRFIFDGVDQNVSSSNMAAKRSDIENKVQGTMNQSPQLQVGLNATHDGDNIHVQYKVQLFQDVTGAHNVAFYLVEKLTEAYQATIGAAAQHKVLLRAEMSANAFGEELFSGGAQAGDVFEGNSSLPIGNYNSSNLSVVAVLWKNDGGDYIHVNANIDKEVEFETSSSIDRPGSYDGSLSVYPTITSDQATIKLDLLQKSDLVIIRLLDQSARVIKHIHYGPLEKGLNEFKINSSDLPFSGSYFISSQNGPDHQVKRLIFE